MKNFRFIKYLILAICVASFVSAYAADIPTLILLKNGQVYKTLTAGELSRLKEGAVSVKVDNPTDSKAHTYDGILLSVLLERVFGKNWKEFELVKFTSQDGYQPVIPLEQILAANGLISMGEGGSSQFQKLLRKNGETIDPGPFYLVWENIKNKESREDPWLSWPWQIKAIELTNLAREFPRSAPPRLSGDKVKEGFLAFRQHCIKCHSINGDGGNVGPELNYPVNVTEYWKEEWLARFIANPQSVRANSRMIPFYRDVKNRKEVISSIITYLKTMKGK